MVKKADPRDARKGQDQAAKGSNGDSIDLLEVGSDDDLLEFEDSGELQARIKVIGVGGAGGNALDTMIRQGLGGVEFVVANTDAQALKHKLAPTKLQLGTEVTRGLGCGAKPELGRAAALEDRDRLRDLLVGSDMVFVTAGLGGGTGTGAAPIVAEVAREVGALTVAVVSKPFPFEGRKRMRHADQGLEELHRVVDTLITIPNQRLLALANKDTPIDQSFVLADEVLLNAVKGISDLITVHGIVNLDFADVRTIMNEMGMALMGTGACRGEGRAREAAYAAISSPLLEDASIEGARGVLINITGGPDMTLWDVNEASTLVQEAAHEDANIIFGAVIDDTLPEGEIRVTVIATGLDDERDWQDRQDRRAMDSELHSRHVPSGGGDAHPQASRDGQEALQGQVEEPAPEIARDGGSLEEFVSPFDEDSYEVPTFIRKEQDQRDGEEDREIPAFLRRKAE